MATDSATETKPRTPRARRAGTGESSARRSAVAKAEPRDEEGKFERKPTRKASAKSGTTDGFSVLKGGTGVALAAGAGLAVGLAANVARKLAVQAPTLIAGDWDEALAAEHKLTLKVFDAIEATTEKNTSKRALLLMNLKHMLSKHAMEEENVIYPAMRDAGETEAADHLNSDHGYVKQYVFDLTDLPKDAPAWIVKVRTFRADIEAHMREEEDVLFPRLKGKLTAERNKELTAMMNKEGLKLA